LDKLEGKPLPVLPTGKLIFLLMFAEKKFHLTVTLNCYIQSESAFKEELSFN